MNDSHIQGMIDLRLITKQAIKTTEKVGAPYACEIEQSLQMIP